MDQIFHIIAIVFWGLVVLSLLVYIHEAGHFIAARIMGLRVKEFFIGLPCSVRLSRVSKKTGTAYGITPLLMGGYTLICGMDGSEPDCMARVLSYVYKEGTTTISSAAKDLRLSEDDVEAALLALSDWGSIEETMDGFQTLARDAHMRTIFDKGHNFSEKGSTQAGERHPYRGTQKAFLQKERSHTYQKLGFWGRAFVLISGILINIVAGFLIVVLVLTCLGIPVASGDTVTQVHLSLPDACAMAASYIGMTAVAIAQLFNPAHFQEVISQSSSVVGISVMAANAAREGITSLLILTAAVSLSLGFMNLLPIPPLDGGKILIEAISALIRRPVPMKIQRIISYVGVLLFILLFIVLLRQDIVRYILGG